jgi:FlaA1/EpsC-like NDP-sugar epimerase
MGVLRKHRNVVLFIMDILIIFLAYFISSFILTNTDIFFTERNMEFIVNISIISFFVYQIIFNLLGLYKNITRYENGKDYISYIIACIISGLIILLIDLILKNKIVDYKQIILSTLLIMVAMVSYRVIIRFILTRRKSKRR